MECVILIRMSNDKVIAMMDDDQEYVALFPHIDDAVKVADDQILCKVMPYQIVELDEL